MIPMKQLILASNAYLKKQPRLLAVLSTLLTVSTLLFYLSFGVQCLLLFTFSIEKTILFITYNAVVFIGVTLLRKVINRKRPYEALNVTPVISKDTIGQSFPSRHAFSAWLITFNWLILGAYMPYISFGVLFIIFSVIALIICILRVCFTIHYASDVCAGALIALIALIGYLTLLI